jgi:ABC-type spermidine/putrescine transport system permease subunit II
MNVKLKSRLLYFHLTICFFLLYPIIITAQYSLNQNQAEICSRYVYDNKEICSLHSSLKLDLRRKHNVFCEDR